MPSKPSNYEQLQIESVLQTRGRRIRKGVGLYLAPMLHDFNRVHDAAVAPAMRDNGINRSEIVHVFGSDALLSEVCDWALSAELIIADVSGCNADLMYILGLCHGLHRCPLIIGAANTDPPFNLAALRYIEYRNDTDGLWTLRESLERAIRTHLAACRAKRGRG